MKYYGCETKQDFVDELYEGEMDIFYRDAMYVFWLDGRDYCIGMTLFGTSNVTSEEHSKSVKAYKTPEELIADYTFYDGTKLCDAMLLDYREIAE